MEGFWKRMTCRFLGGIGHCRPSPLTVVFTVILFYVVHPAAGSALSSLPDLDNDVNKLLNDPRFQKGQYGARAVDLAARQSHIDINGDAFLIPALTTKLIINSCSSPAFVASLPLSYNGAYERPEAECVLEGGLYIKGYGDPALVISRAAGKRKAWQCCPSVGCSLQPIRGLRTN
jgi:D-alanyl-D-alanine carboxypeptidase